MFGDLTSAAGLKKLNDFLLDKSYIKGTQPTQADVTVFTDIKKVPSADLVNCLRWYNHIKSYGDEKKKFPAEATTAAASKEDDDDFELFGSDEEVDEEAEKLKQQRLDAYAAKKSTKAAIIAKSNIVLDVKPWDDETNMKDLEKCVRSVQCDGLLWGASKLVPLAYGIKKLQITCVVEDDKVGTDFLEEQIQAHEDLVQSVDIAAFNKI